MLDEAHRVGLPTTAHIGVEETTARDYIELGVTSIEHFYGIADAALDGRAAVSARHELRRRNRSGSRRAGELYAQADPERLRSVIDLMIEKKVAWSPTLSIYEAAAISCARRTCPGIVTTFTRRWRRSGSPALDRHGSFFFGWTNTQEVRWRQNYRIWMDARPRVRLERRADHDRR